LSSRAKVIALLVFVSVVLFVPTIISTYVGTHTILRDVDCAKCHSDIIAEQQLSSKGTHRSMDCSSCHKYTTASEFHTYTLNTTFGAMSEQCGSCHSSIYTDWKSGGHANVAECWQCHTNWNGTLRNP
jgi:hypothetical protein